MLSQVLAKIVLAIALVAPITAFAQHDHHAKHNMLLFGTDEVFASHIVYKVPHNFQVVLQIALAPEVKQAYLDAKKAHPTDTFILLLDPMDISKVAEMETLSGTLLRSDAADQQATVSARVILKKGEFKILYFDELPLSLARNQA